MRFFPVSFCGLAIVLASCGPPPGPVGLEPANVIEVPGASSTATQVGGSSTSTTGAASSTGSTVAVTADGSCNADRYKDLVGQPITVVDTLNTGVQTRVLAADAFVTRDFNPNRLTFTTTRAGEIGRVFCG